MNPLCGPPKETALKTPFDCAGYIATAAHTFVVGSTATVEKPLTGRQADVLTAAHIASEVVTKLMRPGNTNSQITAAIAQALFTASSENESVEKCFGSLFSSIEHTGLQVAASFGVSAVSGVLSHRMKRFVIDGAAPRLSLSLYDAKG